MTNDGAASLQDRGTVTGAVSALDTEVSFTRKFSAMHPLE